VLALVDSAVPFVDSIVGFVEPSIFDAPLVMIVSSVDSMVLLTNSVLVVAASVVTPTLIDPVTTDVIVFIDEIFESVVNVIIESAVELSDSAVFIVNSLVDSVDKTVDLAGVVPAVQVFCSIFVLVDSPGDVSITIVVDWSVNILIVVPADWSVDVSITVVVDSPLDVPAVVSVD